MSRRRWRRSGRPPLSSHRSRHRECAWADNRGEHPRPLALGSLAPVAARDSPLLNGRCSLRSHHLGFADALPGRDEQVAVDRVHGDGGRLRRGTVEGRSACCSRQRGGSSRSTWISGATPYLTAWGAEDLPARDALLEIYRAGPSSLPSARVASAGCLMLSRDTSWAYARGPSRPPRPHRALTTDVGRPACGPNTGCI
jgi:hypothetical protein